MFFSVPPRHNPISHKYELALPESTFANFAIKLKPLRDGHKKDTQTYKQNLTHTHSEGEG